MKSASAHFEIHWSVSIQIENAQLIRCGVIFNTELVLIILLLPPNKQFIAGHCKYVHMMALMPSLPMTMFINYKNHWVRLKNWCLNENLFDYVNIFIVGAVHREKLQLWLAMKKYT